MDEGKEISQTELPKNTSGNSLSTDDFQKAFGENFSEAIDINTWHLGENLADIFPRIEEEMFNAKSDENRNHKTIREIIFPRIKEKALVPFAGLHDDPKDVKYLLDKIQKGFLFNGAITASGSTHFTYDTVPISITQIGVCLINYEKQHGSYSHRLFRRDLRFKSDDPVQEALDLIEKRRGDEGDGDKRSKLSTLAIRGIKAYTERALLLDKKDSKSKWILGSGTPIPYELMTGFWGSQKELKDKSIALMSRMVLEHQRFVYVQSCEKNQQLWTLGNALKPFEFLIIDTIADDLNRRVETGGTRLKIRDDYKNFANDVGSKVAVGLYKISNQAEPRIFYGHVDHIRTAALVAMADSVFQLYSGNPMLLDLASRLCQMTFNSNDLITSIQQSSLRAEAKLRTIA